MKPPLPFTTFPALGLVAFALVACGSDAERGEGAVRFVADDATPIFEIDGLWTDDWDELPGVRIDTIVHPSQGDELGLMGPLHGAFMPDGRFVLGDGNTGPVWLTSETGGWTSGPTRGEGPGEFRSLGGLWGSGEGFAAEDPLTGAVLSFDARGQLVDRVRIEPGEACAGLTVGGGGPWLPDVQPVGEGEWLIRIPQAASGPDRSSIMAATGCFAIVEPGPAGAQFEVGRGALQSFHVMGGGAGPAPFSGIATAAGAAGSAVFHSGDEPTVTLMDSRAEPRLVLRWTDEPRALDESHRAMLADRIRSLAPPDAPAAGIDEMIRELQDVLPYPESLPHLGDLRLGSDGSIWLGSPERPGFTDGTQLEPLAEWRVVITDPEADEAAVYRVTLPERSTLLGPVRYSGSGRSPNWSGSIEPGDLFVHFRDETDRPGLGLLRHDGGR